VSAAADHNATPEATADDERALLDRRQNDQALGFIKQVLRNVVGDIEDFFEDFPRVLHTLMFLLVVGKDWRQKNTRQE
jgi:hypothetical protein